MKRIMFFTFLSFCVVIYGFSQTDLTEKQLGQYANEFSVHLESLQSFVISQARPGRLTHPNANTALVLSIHELSFLWGAEI